MLDLLLRCDGPHCRRATGAGADAGYAPRGHDAGATDAGALAAGWLAADAGPREAAGYAVRMGGRRAQPLLSPYVYAAIFPPKYDTDFFMLRRRCFRAFRSKRFFPIKIMPIARAGKCRCFLMTPRMHAVDLIFVRHGCSIRPSRKGQCQPQRCLSLITRTRAYR